MFLGGEALREAQFIESCSLGREVTHLITNQLLGKFIGLLTHSMAS